MPRIHHCARTRFALATPDGAGHPDAHIKELAAVKLLQAGVHVDVVDSLLSFFYTVFPRPIVNIALDRVFSECLLLLSPRVTTGLALIASFDVCVLCVVASPGSIISCFHTLMFEKKNLSTYRNGRIWVFEV